MTTIHARCGLAAAAVLWAAVAASTSAAQAPGRAAGAPSEVYRDVYNGWKWWHVYCYRCHGVDALGTTTAPNLTDPMETFTRPEFLRVVRDGRVNTAMQGWTKLLDDKQIGQIYLYVRARADKVLPPGRPDEVGPDKGPWVPPAGWPRR
jgi:mono/diheme cytochrome c family protein